MQQLNGHGASPAAFVDDSEQIRVFGDDSEDVIVGEAETTFEFVDFDLWGPAPFPSPSGYKYHVTFVNTRFT